MMLLYCKPPKFQNISSTKLLKKMTSQLTFGHRSYLEGCSLPIDYYLAAGAGCLASKGQLSNNVKYLPLEKLLAGITMAAIFNAAFSYALFRKTAQTNFCFWQMVQGRISSFAQINEVVGPLCSIKPIRIQIQPSWTIRDFIRHIEGHHRKMMLMSRSIYKTSWRQQDVSPLCSQCERGYHSHVRISRDDGGWECCYFSWTSLWIFGALLIGSRKASPNLEMVDTGESKYPPWLMIRLNSHIRPYAERACIYKTYFSEFIKRSNGHASRSFEVRYVSPSLSHAVPAEFWPQCSHNASRFDCPRHGWGQRGEGD